MFWRAGTIVNIVDPESPFGHYAIRLDKEGTEMNFRFIDTQWVRPGQKADKQPADKVKQQKDGKTGKPDDGAVACAASDDLKGASQPANFKRLIAERYFIDGKNTQGVPTTIQFQTFKAGVTHKWRAGGIDGESPDGPGGFAGATIYPVNAVYTVCEDYPGFKPTGFRGQLLKTDYNNTFYCFKNETGDLQCNLGPGKQSSTKDIPK